MEPAFRAGTKVCPEVSSPLNVSFCVVFLVYKTTCFNIKYRCAGDIKNHLEQSVLSKLPEQYQSHLRQSAASEEDDMGEQIGVATIDRKSVV